MAENFSHGNGTTRRLSTTSVSKSYVDTLEMKRRSVLGRSSAVNEQGSKRTDGLKEQLASYDARLALLRDQLRSSVDVTLRGSAAGAAEAGERGLAGLRIPADDMIPAVSSGVPVESGRNAPVRKMEGGSRSGAKKSVVERLVTATGQGCKEVLEGSLAANGTKSGCMWKTRAFKQEQVKSSCTLKLQHKKSENITIRVTFAPGKSVPAALVFEHAPKATAAFKRVGMVALKKKSVSQTKHVFHLGNGAVVDRFLRVTCVGLIGDTRNKLHAVSYLLVSGDRAEVEGGEGGGDNDEAAETSVSVVSGQSVSEGVYKGDEAEFRVSLECGELEGTLAESGQKALGVQNAQSVRKVDSNPRKKATASGAQSSVSVWERLSNYKPADKGTGPPQPKLRVPEMSATSSRMEKPSQAPPLPPAPLPSLLSSERVEFVEGVLSSFGIGGMEAAELVKNVVFGSSSFVSSLAQDQVDGLVECLPTTEERKLFRSLDHVPGANEAEYFMAELAAIDNLAAKVETKWFLADFDARVCVVQDASNLISTACHEIQGCSKLHLAIRIILSECSETLLGVKLLDVTLLKELKGVAYNEQGSLLHFVAAKLSEAAGTVKVPNLARDIPSCAPATQVTLSDVKAELELLTDGVDEASLAWRADEPAASMVRSRLDTAQSKLSSTEAIVTETEADFLECAINSGLDPASVKSSEELFQALLDFSDDLNNAHLENKCIGFLTKSKTVDQEVQASKPKAKQQLKVNSRRSPRTMAQQSTTSVPRPVSEMSGQWAATPAASVGASDVPSFDVNVSLGNSALSASPETRRGAGTGSQTPLASRVSVEQLMHSAQKTMPSRASVLSTDCDDITEATSAVEEEHLPPASEELSTPVRNLLRSSRALIDSFDLRNVSNVSPIKYVRGSITIEGETAAHDEQRMDEQRPEEEPRPLAEVPVAGPSGADDDHLCEMSSPREDMGASQSLGAPVQKAETVEEIQPDEEAADICEEAQSEPIAGSQRKTLTPEQVAASIDLSLASKLLMNAEKVRASRSSGSSALMKSTRLATPRSLRTSQVPVLGSRGRSSISRHRTQEYHNSGVESHFITPGRTGQAVDVGRSQMVARQDAAIQSPPSDLTPKQAEAVQALGEVIRQSMPSFASLEADEQCGLHLEAQNLDLDKILSTIILNAGNTPTGPLARGVRGGNESLFDGEGAEALRRHEQMHGNRAHRKALLEPIVPAPLGMGVSVSNTVSKGISPQTLARSLQSSMRASVSVPMHSGLTYDQAKRRSVKGSVQFPKGTTTAAIENASDNRTPVDHFGVTRSQTGVRDSKVSRDGAKSYSKAVSKDYSKAPAWKDEPINRSEDGSLNPKPVFMARPTVNIDDIRDRSLNGLGLSAKPELAPEDLEDIPTPHHGFDIRDDDDDGACGLSPLGFSGEGEDQDSLMAKDRVANLWGMRWD